ncbi:MAG: hypothetical protein ACKPB3_07995 [Bacteroidota bacterium]
MKHFGFIKKFVRDFKRMMVLRKSETLRDRVWKQLVGYLDSNNFEYERNDKKHRLQIGFTVNETLTHNLRFDFEGPFLRIHSLIFNYVEEEQATDVMILASHINSILKYGKMTTNTSEGFVQLTNELSYTDVIWNPGSLDYFMRMQASMFEECNRAFQQMVDSHEDPIFIVAQLLENRRSRPKIDE